MSSSPEPSTAASSSSTQPAAENIEHIQSPLPTSEPGSTDGEEPSSSNPQQPSQAPAAGEWQAIWSLAHNAYYFYNAATQETTWSNPLQPPVTEDASAGTVPTGEQAPPATVGPSSGYSSTYDMQAAAAAQGIDPALAYLDPSLAAGPSTLPDGIFTAKFNARTGTFTRPDGRDPTHLSEFERAKRMSEFYFDVNAWEQDVEARKAQEDAEGKKKKKLTKKDLERFKEQKRQKKIAKTAWLRT